MLHGQSSTSAEREHLAAALQLASSRQKAGDLDGAGQIYGEVLEKDPGNCVALHGAGVVAYLAGQHETAVDLVRLAVADDPQPEYLNTLGSAWDALGRTDAAILCYEQALKRDPACVNAHLNLGNAYRHKWEFAKSLQCYELALALDPSLALVHFNLGAMYLELRRFDAAEAALSRAVELQPGLAEAYNALGIVAKERGQKDLALSLFQQALALKPGYPEPYCGMGDVMHAQNCVVEAERSYRRALELNPGYFDAHNNLANALKYQGRLAEAIEHYRKAIAARPEEILAYSNLLYLSNYDPGQSAASIAQAHCDIVSHFESRVAHRRKPHANAPDPDRRLRIAYMSPDFRSHAVSFFIEPILRAHDRARFEVFCYHNNLMADAVTQRLRGIADQWRDIPNMEDEEAAELVRQDGIDILVDLAGHTSKNRLMVFARKPAPVQVTYLGYPATTGLSAMDYRITDAYADPAGDDDRYYTERLLRMPHSTWCYLPPDGAPGVRPTPALDRGSVTFGSFNNISKLNPEVLAAWGAILRALPHSRLLIATVPEGMARERLRAGFGACDIDAERLDFRGWMPTAAFHAAHHEVDIALDPFPVNGGTTTCETLWMGVPVVSLYGATFVGRAGTSLLNAAGLGELVAGNVDDYVATAVRLAGDLDRLQSMRSGMRERLSASPLCDAAQFTLALEEHYRTMWSAWCAAAAPAAA